MPYTIGFPFPIHIVGPSITYTYDFSMLKIFLKLLGGWIGSMITLMKKKIYSTLGHIS